MEQPYCCFCGGHARSAEEDHVPSRSCFVGRQWPEGYSFGACKRCNEDTRQSELIAAFYVRWMDHEEKNLVDADLQRLLQGMKNNHPALLPRTDLSQDEITSALSRVSPAFTHLSMEPLPVVAMPKAVEAHLDRFARKLSCAIFFKETGEIAPLEARILTKWTQYHDKALPEVFEALESSLPALRVGMRSNRFLTDQFKYICGRGEDNRLFAFIAQFGMSIVVIGAVHLSVDTDERTSDWPSLSQRLDEERRADLAVVN